MDSKPGPEANMNFAEEISFKNYQEIMRTMSVVRQKLVERPTDSVRKMLSDLELEASTYRAKFPNLF